MKISLETLKNRFSSRKKMKKVKKIEKKLKHLN
jgi:hypothetical protein